MKQYKQWGMRILNILAIVFVVVTSCSKPLYHDDIRKLKQENAFLSKQTIENTQYFLDIISRYQEIIYKQKQLIEYYKEKEK